MSHRPPPTPDREINPTPPAASPTTEMNPAEDTREWLNQLDQWESGVDTFSESKVRTGVDGSALAQAYDSLAGTVGTDWSTDVDSTGKGALDFDSPPVPPPAPTVRVAPLKNSSDLLAEVGESLDRALAVEVAMPPESRVRGESPEIAGWLAMLLAELSSEPADATANPSEMFEAALISRQLRDKQHPALLERALRSGTTGPTPYLPIARLGLQSLRAAAAKDATTDARRSRYRFEQCLRFIRQLSQAGVDAPEYRRIAIELETTLGLSGASVRSTHAGPNDVIDSIDTALSFLAQGRLESAAEGFEAAAHQLGGRPGAALAATASLAFVFRGLTGRAASARADALAMDEGNLAAGMLVALDFMIERSGDGEITSEGSPSLGAVRAVTGLSARELRGSVLRFVGRVCERQGDTEGAARLASIAAGGALPSELPFEDRMILLSRWLNEAADPLAALEIALAGSTVSGPEIALLAAAACEILTALGRPDLAVAAIRRGLQACPDATFLALVAEPLAERSGAHREDALRLWGAGDPARRAAVQLALAEVALLRGDSESFARAAKTALENAGGKRTTSSEPGSAMAEGLFIDFAWWALHNRDAAAARAFLAQGEALLSAAGANELAEAFRDRGELARLSEHPISNVTKALAPTLVYWVSNVHDHPRSLALALVDPGDRKQRFAARLRSAAMPTRSYTTRVIEAVFWLSAAGDNTAALQFLAPRWHSRATPALLSLMRRLLVRTTDPEERIAILQKLEAEADDPSHAAALAFLRAETMMDGGRHHEADALLRELSPGPLHREVNTVHHPLLWMAGEARLLDASLRDEIEARIGLGRKEEAAPAILERATVLLLLGDRDGAAELANTARDHAAENPGIAIQALSLNPSPQRTSELRKQLSPGNAPLSALFRALIDTDRTSDWSTHGAAIDAVDPGLMVAIRFESARRDQARQNHERAIARLQEALAVDPSNPWLHGQIAISYHARREVDQTIASLRAAAENFTSMALRARYFFAAAILCGDATESLEEQLLVETLAAVPGHTGAYRRLAGILTRRNDLLGVAALMERQANHTQDPVARAALHLRRVDVLLELGLKTESKEALRVLLTEQPKHPTALYRMGDLEFEDGAFAIAAELYLRLINLDPDPETAKKVLRRLGRVFHRRLNDTKQAVTAYARVLVLDPENVEALSALSLLYAKQNDSKRAVEVTEKAIALESDPNRRITLLVQLASLFEKDGDLRRAASLLGQAVGEGRRSLQAVGELSRFYERHRDTQSRQVLLDTTLALVREDIVRDPASLDALRTVVPLLRWRKRAAGSTAMAQLLAALSPDAHERGEISKWAHAPRKGRRLSSLGNSELDELTNPGAHILGLRHVMRLCGPEIAALRKPDLRPFSIGRAQRVATGRGPRTIFDPLAVDLSQKGFELYISAEQPTLMVVEPGDPPAIILGQAWVDAGEVALRFAAGMTLRLASTHLDLLAVGRKDEGAALLGAIIREFIPGHVTLDVEPSLVTRFQAKIGRALSRSLRSELSPFITEIAGAFDPAALRVEALATGARAGLLCCGDLGVALRVLIRSQTGATTATQSDTLDPSALRKNPVAADLIAFVLSSEYEMLVRSLDSVS